MIASKHSRCFRDVGDVRRLLRRAIDKGLVEFKVRAPPVVTAIDKELSTEVADKARCRRAIVVAVDPVADEGYRSPDPETRERSLRGGDDLNEALGWHAAKHLLSRLESNDYVAVGGGRAVALTIKGIEAHEPVLGDHHVISLSGGRIRQPWAGQVGAFALGADDNASRLAMRILPRAKWTAEKIHLCGLPGFIDDHHTDLIDAFAPHLVAEDAITAPDQTYGHAIFGAGVLDASHYLMRAKDPQTDVIREELTALTTILSAECPAPVVDFCDFFMVGPRIPKKARKIAEEIVSGLNAKVVTAAPDKLNNVRERILVAGGPHKHDVLELLASVDCAIRPTMLVTDRTTAKELLRRLDV